MVDRPLDQPDQLRASSNCVSIRGADVDFVDLTPRATHSTSARCGEIAQAEKDDAFLKGCWWPVHCAASLRIWEGIPRAVQKNTAFSQY